MYRLRVLPKVIESRKASGTMTLKRPFAGVFPDVSRQVFASGKTEVAWRIIGAVKSLRLFLFRLCAVCIDALVIRPRPIIASNPFTI